MKITLSQEQFIDHFMAIRPDNFSREGLGEIFSYFEEMGEENEMEFDPIAICCTFSQCSLNEFLEAFQVADNDDIPALKSGTIEEKQEAISDYIAHNGFWHSFVEDGQEIVFENF